ncbi:hypothetical protein XJ44_03860 [Thermosipho affectus]|uniref:Lipoprotein n=1 Tax=Thermosipho affectus TaxID=660294 RepID=A0ABX3IJF2_9BACT|nr:hypothetical protein [Thermosipho affectus]ONN27458.1 hypothetical protein XJ44_03860 [Thermosipho affectus]
MKKIIYTLGIALLVILSSCGIFNRGVSNSTDKVVNIQTLVEIKDPYGKDVYVSGKINGFDIVLANRQVGVEKKLSKINSVVLDTNMFDYTYTFDGKKVTINLKIKKDLQENFAEIQKNLKGQIVLYTYKLNAAKFNVWLDDMLDKEWIENRDILSSDENIIAGNYLISVLSKSIVGTKRIETEALGDVKVKRIQIK